MLTPDGHHFFICVLINHCKEIYMQFCTFLSIVPNHRKVTLSFTLPLLLIGQRLSISNLQAPLLFSMITKQSVVVL